MFRKTSKVILNKAGLLFLGYFDSNVSKVIQ